MATAQKTENWFSRVAEAPPRLRKLLLAGSRERHWLRLRKLLLARRRATSVAWKQLRSRRRGTAAAQKSASDGPSQHGRGSENCFSQAAATWRELTQSGGPWGMRYASEWLREGGPHGCRD